MAQEKKLAVVTGASSGIGRATARELARRGLHVLAGVRRSQDADGLAAEGLEPALVDITDDAGVASLAAQVRADGRPLRALVNNAGVAINAPVEALPLEAWRRQFEVNLFGHVAVTQALLPALLQAQGRIANVSSIGGRIAGPTFGAYAASKFALEGLSDVLRREVGRLGVHVIVVEPGTVATPIWSKGRATAQDLVADLPADQRARYGELVTATQRQAEEFERTGIAPEVVARVIAGAIEARRPRTRYLVGRDAKVGARVAALLPDRAVDWLLARALAAGAASDSARVG